VTILGVAPTTVINGAPASALEGTSVALTGSATAAFSGDSITGYAWSVTKDGSSFGIPGTGTGFTFTPDDEGTFVVTLQATDDDNMIGTKSVIITGLNAPPIASMSEPTGTSLVLVPFQTLTFQGTFTDPGVLDKHTATWTFGDGQSSTTSFDPSGSGSTTATHAYSSPGNYPVTLTVSDDDGGTGQVTKTVSILTPAAALGKITNFVQGLVSCARSW